MGYTLTEKIIKDHLVSGEMVRGEKISIHIDKTLTQDATGTMAYLELEALGVDKIKTDFSVSYVDHNTLQTGFENANRFKKLFISHDEFANRVKKIHGNHITLLGKYLTIDCLFLIPSLILVALVIKSFNSLS